MKNIKEELNLIAHKNRLNTLPWGTKGGNGWIWFKQDDEKKFRIQISLTGSFEVYKNVKSEIVSLFSLHNCTLSREQDLNPSFGYTRNLYFMDAVEFNVQILDEDNKRNMSNIYNIGQINADGGIVTIGNVVNSTQSIDNSIQRIKNKIEQEGGTDKEELYSILNEIKETIGEISKTKEIKTNENLIKRLNNHMSKHGWFYGEIIGLLGTALLGTLG